ncbi:MAG: hypothetical protein ACPGVB_05550, partial [Chitinophagales bacterium]
MNHIKDINIAYFLIIGFFLVFTACNRQDAETSVKGTQEIPKSDADEGETMASKPNDSAMEKNLKIRLLSD